ncbi:hypothetical protein Prum_046920 [Phytohabitans rumicis]|uniref:Uncharacterized protein n=2 Tax=Phytohabitans rumicis TaxID=1076125 RepID=A0A6V8L620_9ACTN|nr:hypothetical protein Prum_046920 [Phytohabitans rumicis]
MARVRRAVNRVRDRFDLKTDRAWRDLRRQFAPLIAREPGPDRQVQAEILQRILATPSDSADPFAVVPAGPMRRWPVRVLTALTLVVLVAFGVTVIVRDGRAASGPTRAAAAPAASPVVSASAAVNMLPACAVPPAGVLAPTDVRLQMRGADPVRMTVIYSHRASDGQQVWHAYGPAGQDATHLHKVSAAILPALTNIDVKASRQADGSWRFIAPPCTPIPYPASPPKAGANTGVEAQR